MLKFYYNPFYKYTNRTILDVSSDNHYKDIDYENIDTPDTINGHIIYTLDPGENIPTYVVENNTRKWYVTGITQLRTGKYQISLLRDIISENPNLWKNESAYIEAGTATDYCRYKKWGLPFTNTKIKEERLDINGKSSFFVFYTNQVDTSQLDNGIIIENDLKLKYEVSPISNTAQHTFESLEDIPGYEYIGIGQFNYLGDNPTGEVAICDKSIGTYENNKYRAGTRFVKQYDINGNASTNVTYNTQMFPVLENGISYSTFNAIETDAHALRFKISGTLKESVINILNDSITRQNASILQNGLSGVTYSNVNKNLIKSLDSIINQTIRIQTSPTTYNYYKINRTINNTNSINYEVPLNTNISQQMLTSVGNLIDDNKKVNARSLGAPFFFFRNTSYTKKYELVYLGEGTEFNFNLKANVQKLPKSNVRCVNIVSDNMISDDYIMKSLMIAQTNQLAQDNNIGRIIDIQYLPFSVATTSNTSIKFGEYNAIAEFLTDDDFYYYTNLPDITNINKETDSITIVSPSRKSQFKFSPYYNDGNMEFSTRITIKPMQSVIYVRPSTKGLLLKDWDDKDCLIIQEDFSLTTTNSAWTTYVNSNRNYQNAFNLQVQTKEYEREWERKIEHAQAKSDIYTAANISIQRGKTFSGNIPILSDLAGAIYGLSNPDMNYMQAAQLDRDYNEAMHQKSLEISRTTFEYQLDNIKSQPLIPNTITAIDVKLLDGIYLEFYSTNATELESISNYYINNGNRIDNYGTFAKYWGNFVRGKIIRSINYTQPEVDELNLRLQSGIYTGGIV